MNKRNPERTTGRGKGVRKGPELGVVVEGTPDDERIMAALEWLLYRRGPLARMMHRQR